MRLLLVNPNTTETMTTEMYRLAMRYVQPGTEIEAVTAAFGSASIEGHWEEEYGILASLEAIEARRGEVDGVVLACFGDPGLYAAREISPAPVVGIAEASMHLACLVAHKFSIVTVLPRVRPMLENMVALHGLTSRCASIRTTALGVLDIEQDAAAATQQVIDASIAAVEEDGAEAICLGCSGMGALYDALREALDIPVIDGVIAATKLLEAIVQCRLETSRVAAFKSPEEKHFVSPYAALSDSHGHETGRAPLV